MLNSLTMLVLSGLLILMGMTLSKKSFMDKEKVSPFECGFDPYSLTRLPFSVRFFKIAIIFLIFDIEIILILPLPALSQLMNSFMFLSSVSIIATILGGLFYEWHQGSLTWVT